MFYNDFNTIILKDQTNEQYLNNIFNYGWSYFDKANNSKLFKNKFKYFGNALINCTKDDFKNNDVIIIGASIRYGKHNPKVIY